VSKEIWGGGSMPLGSRGDKSSTTFSSLSEFSAEEHLTRLFGKDHGPATKDQGPFRSLAGETNPEIFFQDLLQIAQKAEDKQDLQLASTVFAYVFQNAPQPSLRKQAEARLAGITGQGGTGAGRLEHLSRSWMDHAFDPAALAGMSAAGLAFQSGKLFTMARLWGKAAPQGIRIGGALGGFAVEVPAFVAVTKGASASMGREVDWSAQAWKTELISGAMVLGALKLSGFASGSGINKLHGVNPVTGQATRFAHWLPTTRTLGTQTGMLGGIMTGHSMEAAYFGHETPEGVNNLLDSFATLLQFNVAGKLTPMMAPRAHALSQQLGAESHRLSQNHPLKMLETFDLLGGKKVSGLRYPVSGLFPVMATPNALPPPSSKGTPTLPNIIAMMTENGGGNKNGRKKAHIEEVRDMLHGQRPGSAPLPYELLETKLHSLTHPNANGIRDFHFQIDKLTYWIVQADPGAAIQVVIKPQKKGSSSFGLTYLSDGNMASSRLGSSEPNHTSKIHSQFRMTSEERYYNRVLQHYLSSKAEVLFRAQQLFINLEAALGDLRGTFDPKEGTVRYDNFVALKQGGQKAPRVFSFEFMSGNSQGKSSDPHLDELKIFENTGRGYETYLRLKT